MNFLQIEHRKRVAADMLERVNSDPTLMQRIITGDKTCAYEYDMQASEQASKWRQNRKKPRQSHSKAKVYNQYYLSVL